MKLCWFHLMPYASYQKISRKNIAACGSMSLQELYDAEKTHGLYNEFLDELEYADQCGFDGLCVVESSECLRPDAYAESDGGSAQ